MHGVTEEERETVVPCKHMLSRSSAPLPTLFCDWGHQVHHPYRPRCLLVCVGRCEKGSRVGESEWQREVSP